MPTKRNIPSRNANGSRALNQVLVLTRRQGVLRARDLEAAGLPRAYLTRLVQRGRLARVTRGLYRLPSAR